MVKKLVKPGLANEFASLLKKITSLGLVIISLTVNKSSNPRPHRIIKGNSSFRGFDISMVELVKKKKKLTSMGIKGKVSFELVQTTFELVRNFRYRVSTM